MPKRGRVFRLCRAVFVPDRNDACGGVLLLKRIRVLEKIV